MEERFEGHTGPMDEVGRAVVEFQNATDLVDEAAAAWLGVNRSDLRCLALLFFQGPLTAGELAHESQLSPGAITALADRLERAALAVRLRDPKDRRRVLLAVTERAKAATEVLYGPIARAGHEIAQSYAPAERELLIGFLAAGRELQERHAARIRDLPSLLEMESQRSLPGV